MKSLQQFLAFAATARSGSFAAAARDLGQAPSTVAKCVARLEAQLGLRLFHRTTRQVRLTPDGERLFARCERILAEVEDLETEAADVRAAPSGVLRLDAPNVFGRRFIVPVLVELQRRHPGLSVDLRLTDRYTDIISAGLDAAIRVGALDDSALAARPFARHVLIVVASPAYLAQRGRPRRLADLERHDCILARLPSSGRERPWRLRVEGRVMDFVPRSRSQFDDGEAVLEAVRLGLGIGQVPDYMAADAMARGDLVEILPSLRPPAERISIVWPAAKRVPPRLRALIAVLAPS